MSKKKARNTLKKEAAKKAKLDKKKRTQRLSVIIAIAVIAVIAMIAIFMPKSNGVIFKYKEGTYIDPTTDKVYCPTDTSTYLIKTEFFKNNYYGKMGKHKVYTIPGVKNKDWLVRQLTDDLFELYHEESVHLPEISEFEATELYLFVDAPVIFYREEIKNESEIDNIVSILTNGEKVNDEDTGEFLETYSIRFVSEKYDHMYYCVEYVITESGSYFYDHLSFSYIKANGILDGYVESLKEQRGE